MNPSKGAKVTGDDVELGDNGSLRTVHFTVNGDPVTIELDGDERLAGVLRSHLGLTGTKLGCEVGVCGVCTVLVDERPTSSCITLLAQVDGTDVLTVEGVVERPGMERLQQAFIRQGAFQCGFCTSGQLVNAAPLIAAGHAGAMSDDELAEHLHGNLCRCTGYYGILRAIQEAAR